MYYICLTTNAIIKAGKKRGKMLERTYGIYLPFTDPETSGAEIYHKDFYYKGIKGRWL
jgi:hypothetical protein